MYTLNNLHKNEHSTSLTYSYGVQKPFDFLSLENQQQFTVTNNKNKLVKFDIFLSCKMYNDS